MYMSDAPLLSKAFVRSDFVEPRVSPYAALPKYCFFWLPEEVMIETKNHLQNNPLKSQKWGSTIIGSSFWTGTDT